MKTRLEMTICSNGAPLPRLYLLGQQKSGSTTMATALYQAGAVPMVQNRSGGNIPIYISRETGGAFNHSRVLLAGNVKESNLIAGLMKTCWSQRCLDAARLRWEARLSGFGECAQWDSTLLADMSTDTFRSSAHAALLFHMYSVTDVQRLIFVVIMREPLSRFKSGFYWDFNPKFLGLPRGVRHAHNRTLDAELHMLRHALPPDFKTARTVAHVLADDWRFDRWYRSMYSLNWHPWLDQFDPAQFVALPMRWALADLGRAVGLVASRFGVPLWPQAHIRGGSRNNASDVLNRNAHAAAEPDSDEALLYMQWLVDTFFAPDAVELSHMFARAIPKGLTLGGSGAGDWESVRQHLQQSW